MQISFGGGIEKLKSNEFLPEGFSIIEEWREHFQLDEIPHDRTKCFASGSITLRRCKEEGENSQRGVRGRQWKWTIVQLVVLSVCVCVCVCCILRPLFTSRVVIFYCHSLPRIRFSFFPHSISSFLFNLITVTHDWTISNGIMVIPRSYIFQLTASILISVYLANLHISFDSGYSERMFYFWCKSCVWQRSMG